MPARFLPHSLLLHVAALACLLLWAAPGSAVLIQVDFTGVVAVVPEPLVGGPIADEDPVTGRFIYDTAVSDVSDDPNNGFYPNAVQSFEIAIGSYSIATTSPTGFQVRNDAPSVPSPIDNFLVNAQENAVVELDGDPINGLDPFRMQWGPFSRDLTRVLSDAIPDVEGILRFLPDEAMTNFNFVSFEEGNVVRWNQDSITARVIPEPATAMLLGLGLAGLSVAGRRLA